VIDARLQDVMAEVANKVAGLPDSHPEEDQLHLANQLRPSAAVISMGLDIIKTDVSQQKQQLDHSIERIEFFLRVSEVYLSLVGCRKNTYLSLERGALNS